METNHLTIHEIEAGLPHVLAAPQDQGTLDGIYIRPRSDERTSRQSVSLSPKDGIHGDRWATATGLGLPDGGPDPDVQVSLMNVRILQLIARREDRMGLAGDNLIVDLDLSADNIPVGQKLAVGAAVIQVTDVPHTGCGKFAARFGADAARFINAAERKSLHLRGRYARVVKAGAIRVGDIIRKVD